MKIFFILFFKNSGPMGCPMFPNNMMNSYMIQSQMQKTQPTSTPGFVPNFGNMQPHFGPYNFIPTFQSTNTKRAASSADELAKGVAKIKKVKKEDDAENNSKGKSKKK